MGIFKNNQDDPNQQDSGGSSGLLAQPDDPDMLASIDDMMAKNTVKPDANEPTATDKPEAIEIPATVNEPEPEKTEAPAEPTPNAGVSVSNVPVQSADDDLESIKKDALRDLTPLVDHLDQSPEEKFMTTMMLLQSTDDKSLVKTAYEAAKLISDEKTRAQALLDIVKEINYFNSKPE